MAYRPFPIMEVDINYLLLDLENYRIPTRREDQESALKYLFASEDVIGAMKSILKHGYFDNEVPIVTPASKTGGDQTYVVLEGNRRVSALKALRDPMIIPGRMKEIQNLAKRYALEVQELRGYVFWLRRIEQLPLLMLRVFTPAFRRNVGVWISRQHFTTRFWMKRPAWMRLRRSILASRFLGLCGWP